MRYNHPGHTQNDTILSYPAMGYPVNRGDSYPHAMVMKAVYSSIFSIDHQTPYIYPSHLRMITGGSPASTVNWLLTTEKLEGYLGSRDFDNNATQVAREPPVRGAYMQNMSNIDGHRRVL